MKLDGYRPTGRQAPAIFSTFLAALTAGAEEYAHTQHLTAIVSNEGKTCH
jgi:hypothetical protein